MTLTLTTHKKNNIYVIDSLSEYRERNVVLGREGGVVAIYDGHAGINDRDHPFTPRDLVTTELGNIIVLDEENHMLHIHNNTEQCVKYYSTKEIGIEWPHCLNIDSRGHLIIGFNTAKEKYVTKHYIVQYSGF